MIYSLEDLTGEELLLPQLPLLLNSHTNCMLLHWLLPQPLPSTHTQTTHTPFSFVQGLFMFECLGLCVFGLPCPLKRALINGYFINQEVLAGSKRLWGQSSAEVLSQFPNPPGLYKFCFLAARRFIIILPLRRNETGRAGGLDVKQRYRRWEAGIRERKTGEWKASFSTYLHTPLARSSSCYPLQRSPSAQIPEQLEGT